MADSPAPPQDLVDEFVGACHGDFNRVRELLDEYPGLLSALARWSETPLGAAAHVGQEDIARYLLEQGAPLDICAAAMLGMKDRVTALLAVDPAQAEAAGAHGLSALYHAALRGRTAIAEMLLAYGADVNAGAGANTALHGAAAFGQREMAEWLLARGARPDVRDHKGRTTLQVALDAGHAAVADVLQRHGATG